MAAASTPFVLARVDRHAGADSHPRHHFPPLDLKMIQSALAERGESDVPLLDGCLEAFCPERFAARLLAFHPRIVVLRAVSYCLCEAITVGKLLRAAGVLTVAVGQQVEHVRQRPERGWDEAFDLAVAGEAEAVLPELLMALQSGVAPNFLQARLASSGLNLVSDPAAVPAPRFSSDELLAYPFPFPLRRAALQRWGYVLTAWGCPRPCRHCTSIVRKSVGRPLRARPLSMVVDEIAGLCGQGIDGLAIEDDSLFVHRRRFLDLAEQMVRRGLVVPWIANARPDELDEETAAAARASGCILLKVGVDSGSRRMIETIGKGPSGDEWMDRCRQSFVLTDRHGIGTVALFVLGLPGESSADVQASLDLACALSPDYVQVQRYQPYPDSPFWRELGVSVQEGARFDHYGVGGINCSAMTASELADWPGQFYRRFYLRPGFVATHLRRSWRHYLNRGALLESLSSPMSGLQYLLRQQAGAR